MTIGLSTVVVRMPGLLTAPVDDEIVILNPARDNYVGLDAIGRAVWDLIEQPSEVSQLCHALSQRFDATPGQVAADLLPFLAELAAEGVARVVAEPLPNGDRGAGAAVAAPAGHPGPAVPPGGGHAAADGGASRGRA